MKKYQKETFKYSLEEEKKILKNLEKEYKESGKIIKKRIKTLMERDDAKLEYVIHQIKYQKALKSQIDDVLDKLQNGTFKTIQDYMSESYSTGFTSSLYRLQKQGIPLLFPMDKGEILKAVNLNSKISKNKYQDHFTKLKNTIRHEVTRGVSTSMSYGDIARNIDNSMNTGLYNSYRIARTEGHRINQEASFDVMMKEKEAGAEIVKQWDSTLDGRTRPTHRKLDGQIRELEDEFEVNGMLAMFPHQFGKASEDINCRCVILELGTWELEEDDTYSKFDGNSGVIVKDLSNAENYNVFKVGYYDNLLKHETIKLNMLNTSKVYTGIWKDGMTIKDYPSKKDSIPLKKQYFNDQIAQGNKVSQFQKALLDLDEFETEGLKYEASYLKVNEYKKKYNDLKKNLPVSDKTIIDDKFSEDRKNNAYWFTPNNGATKGADAILRQKCGEVWRNASDFEKDSIYEYTLSYHKFNEPLRGIEYGTNKYLGVGNVDMEAIGVSYAGFKRGKIKKQIDAMTDIINRSSYNDDIWLQRGCGYNGMDKFFNIDSNDFYLSESELANKLVGTTPIEYGFMSTSVTKGKGFSGNPIILNVYAPSGTKMMYAEPFSAFGKGGKKNWDGLSQQGLFGDESEMIINRGTKFVVTKVEKNNGKIYIDMDVIGQGEGV